MAKHLAIFVGDYIKQILSGTKTIEVRLSQEKIVPYGAIAKGDEILLKKSGREILGAVEVDNVLFYENLTPELIGRIRKEYNKELNVDNNFWQAKANSRYASLIFLKNPRRFLAPMKFRKKDRRPWVIIDKNN
jgi:ASC-1-like (ASCH) protein